MNKPSDPTDKPKRKRATNAAMQARVSKVLTGLHMGYGEDRIKQILRDEDGLEPWTVRRTFDKAMEVIRGLGSMPTDKERGTLIGRLTHIYKQTQTGETKNLDQGIKVLNIFASILPKDKKGISHGSGHSEVKAPPSSSKLDDILAKLGSTSNAEESKPG
jgi:hypothetical protein